MSARGWHLSGFSCGILYRFEAGEPHAYDYAVDFQRDFSAEAQELYRIGGWQSVALGSSWQTVSYTHLRARSPVWANSSA